MPSARVLRTGREPLTRESSRRKKSFQRMLTDNLKRTRKKMKISSYEEEPKIKSLFELLLRCMFLVI